MHLADSCFGKDFDNVWYMSTVHNVDKAKQDIEHAFAIQSSPGNWNVSPYMLGMHNGLAYARACLNGGEPEYKSPPDKWLDIEYQNVTKPIALHTFTASLDDTMIIDHGDVEAVEFRNQPYTVASDE